MNKKLVPAIGILLVLGVGGYIFMQQKSQPKVSPEVKKAQQEVMASCKYDQEFCKYAASGIVAMSGGYTMTSESTYGGKKTKMVMKSDGKENSESVTYGDNGKEEGSFISLNKTTYMKGPGETVWTEFPATKDESGKQSTNLFDFEGLKKELGDLSKEVEDTLVVKKVGTERCGKLTCAVFEMTEKVCRVRDATGPGGTGNHRQSSGIEKGSGRQVFRDQRTAGIRALQLPCAQDVLPVVALGLDLHSWRTDPVAAA